MKEYIKFVFILPILLSWPSWAQDEETAKLGEIEATGSVLSQSSSVGYEGEKEKEINELVTVFSRPFMMKQHVAAEALAYLGHSDPRIFDLVEKQLLDNYRSLKDDYAIDWASWLAKALGFSGDEKYLPTLQTVASSAPDEKLRKYAGIAMSYTAKYMVFNPIIMNLEEDNSQTAISSQTPRLPLALVRYRNMLNSDVPELHKLAAKRIFFEGIIEDSITKLVLFRIDNPPPYPAPRTDTDTKKWLKKSLCNSCRNFGSRRTKG